MDFFSMDLNTLPRNASSLKFSKHNAHVMSLCLTLHVNLGLSLRKTSQALKDLYNISISHQQIANYCKTAAICVKPFVDQYPYEKGDVFTADETYIKIRGIKNYVWLIMNAATRSIIGYQVSDNRGAGPCILAMRMAFRNLTKLPENFKFIADGYSAYPLAAMEFVKKLGRDFTFKITQVIGLTNDDAVSTEYRPFKQMIERLNRTYKPSYRRTNGFDNIDGANYDLALWVAYYNFLRPFPAIRRGRVRAESANGSRDEFLVGFGATPKGLKTTNICNFQGFFKPIFRLSFFIDYLTLPKNFEIRFTYEKILISINFIGISFVRIKCHAVNRPHSVVNPLRNLKHNSYHNLIPILFK